MALIATLEGILEESSMSKRNFLSSSLAAVFPGGSLKAQMTAAGAAAAVAAVNMVAVSKIPYLNSSQHLSVAVKHTLLTVLLGLVGGRLAWDQSRDAALGIVGGMGANLGAGAAFWALRQKWAGGTGYLGDTSEIESMMGSLHGMEASTMIEPQETVGDMHGLDASTSIEDDSNLAWIGG